MMRLFVAACLNALSLATTAAPFVVSGPLAAGVTLCGVYVDSAARALSPVAATSDGGICKYDLAGIPAGPHSVTMTAITVDDPYWGSQESAKSSPLAFNMPASLNVSAPLAANFQGLWWVSGGDESGWGLTLAHQGDTIVASWLTYDTTGRNWWLSMTAQKSAANTYLGTLYQTHGPAFNAVPFDPAAVTRTAIGIGTLVFADADNATFTYTFFGFTPVFMQTKNMTREVFGPVPTCAFRDPLDVALATNYQGLWWAAPPDSESGWGLSLTHQGDTIFATWFTYDLDGAPLWLAVTARKSATGTYAGDLYRTAGARLSAFDPASVVATTVGTAIFTFADGNNATFDYSVQLAGMPMPVSQRKRITRETFATPVTVCQ